MKIRRIIDEPLSAEAEARRQFLLRAMAVGAFAGGIGWNGSALASLLGKRPGKLPDGKSIFDSKGELLVNGKPADSNTVIKPGDTIKTAADGYAIFAVGSNAYILRESSTLDLGGAAKVLKQTMRLVTGKLLGVFGRRTAENRLNLRTGNATIGIRGTGLYAEADPEKTYICTCYGTTELVASADYDLDAPPPTKGKKGAAKKPAPEITQVSAKHHDAPKYILTAPDGGKRIVPAPFINHTDLELMTLEALVGREVPFGLAAEQYESPRREY